MQSTSPRKKKKKKDADDDGPPMNQMISALPVVGDVCEGNHSQRHLFLSLSCWEPWLLDDNNDDVRGISI